MSKEKAFDICLELLEQRDYEILDENKDVFYIQALKPNGECMIVVYNESIKFNAKGMKDIISLMETYNVKHSIVVSKKAATSATESTMKQMIDMKIELFIEDDLQFNITKHRLQPTFERLNEDEVKKFKEKYDWTKIPVLCVNQPIARFYDYNIGDIIKITRTQNKVKEVVFRLVK